MGGKAAVTYVYDASNAYNTYFLHKATALRIISVVFCCNIRQSIFLFVLQQILPHKTGKNKTSFGAIKPKEVFAAKTNQALFILGETPAFTAIIPIPANR